MTKPELRRNRASDRIDRIISRELVALVQEGNEEATIHFVTLLYPIVEKYNKRVLWSIRYEYSAEELTDYTNHTVEKVVLGLKELYRQEHEDKFSHWVSRIMKARIIDQVRRIGRARRSGVEEVPESDLAVVFSELATDVLIDDLISAPGMEMDQVDQLIDDAPIWAELNRRILTLTPDQQAVVSCRFIEGLSMDETAIKLDKPLSAVKALQHRAFAQLRKGISSFRDERE